MKLTVSIFAALTILSFGIFAEGDQCEKSLVQASRQNRPWISGDKGRWKSQAQNKDQVPYLTPDRILGFKSVGRAKEIGDVAAQIARPDGKSLLVIGEDGVGRSTIIKEASAIVLQKSALGENGVIVPVDVRKFLSDADANRNASAGFEQIVLDLAKKAREYAKTKKGRVVLYFSNFNDLLVAFESRGQAPALRLIMNDLISQLDNADKDLQVVIEVDKNQFEKFKELYDAATIDHVFNKVEIGAVTDKAVVVQMLEAHREELRKIYGNIVLHREALEAVVAKSDSKSWPGSAYKLLADVISKVAGKPLETSARLSDARSKKDAAEAKKIELEGKMSRLETSMRVDPENQMLAAQKPGLEEELKKAIEAFYAAEKALDDVVTVDTPQIVIDRAAVEKVLGADGSRMPFSNLTRDQLLGMEATLNERVIDQADAMKEVADAVALAASEMGDPDKPIGSFIFVGPSGVGKTLTAQVLADIAYGDESKLVVAQGAELTEKHTSSVLLGSPAGYVGWDEGGLVEQIRKEPKQVFLLDEGEKAHPDNFQALMNIADTGQLTDRHQRKVDFRQSILVVASNAASNYLEVAAKNSIKVSKAVIEEIVRSEFGKLGIKPEVLNRFKIIVFDYLTPEGLQKIANIKMGSLASQLKKRRGITMTATKDVGMLIGEMDYDPVRGARELLFNINTLVRRNIAQIFLEVSHPTDSSRRFERVEGGAIKLSTVRTDLKENELGRIKIEVYDKAGKLVRDPLEVPVMKSARPANEDVQRTKALLEALMGGAILPSQRKDSDNAPEPKPQLQPDPAHSTQITTPNSSLDPSQMLGGPETVPAAPKPEEKPAGDKADDGKKD